MEQNKESQKVLIPTYFIGILTLGATFQLPSNIAYKIFSTDCHCVCTSKMVPVS